MNQKTLSPGICYLDIDGVICTDRAYLAYGHNKTKSIMRAWDPMCIRMIDELCQEYELEVVISSTWRYKYDVPLILLTHGFKSSFHKDDQTPRVFSGSRGMEIRDWMEEHPDVKRHLIIDDSTDGLTNNDLSKYHVITDYADGMLTHHYHAARTIMNEQKNN